MTIEDIDTINIFVTISLIFVRRYCHSSHLIEFNLPYAVVRFVYIRNPLQAYAFNIPVYEISFQVYVFSIQNLCTQCPSLRIEYSVFVSNIQAFDSTSPT